jgi:hypothetical protein
MGTRGPIAADEHELPSRKPRLTYCWNCVGTSLTISGAVNLIYGFANKLGTAIQVYTCHAAGPEHAEQPTAHHRTYDSQHYIQEYPFASLVH